MMMQETTKKVEHENTCWSKPLCVFVASAGRCGTRFLSELVRAAGGIAEHEAPPSMANEVLQAAVNGKRPHKATVLKRQALAARARASLVSNELAKFFGCERPVYLDANHLFVATFADLAAELHGVELLVIVLRRDLVDSVRSRARLGHFGGRECGWIWEPPGATGYGQIEKLCAYHVDVERRCQTLYNTWRLIEVRAEALWQPAGAEKLLAALGLRMTPEANALLAGPKVNQRLAEKSTSLCDAAIREDVEDYLHRLASARGNPFSLNEWRRLPLDAQAAACGVSPAFVAPAATVAQRPLDYVRVVVD